jgi:hypothetical protein
VFLENSTCANYAQVENEGTRKIKREIIHYRPAYTRIYKNKTQ